MDQVKSLLADCKQNGVKLWLEDGKLKYKMPVFVDREMYISKLKAQKDELILYFSELTEEVGILRDEAQRYDAFPLSDVQSAYLLGRLDSFEYSGVSCHIYQEFVYEELEPEKVERVWNQLIQRHDMLRAVIYEDGFQQVMKDTPLFRVPYIDATAPDGREKLEELRIEMSGRIYALQQWPMFSVAVSELPDKFILHFSMEFLVADWTSIWMLIGEFEALYFDKEDLKAPLSLTFRECIITAMKAKESSAYQVDKEYWARKLQVLPDSPTLPQQKLEHGKVHRFRRHFFTMGTELWEKFKKYASVYAVTPTSAVLTAYADVLAKWSENKKLCLNLTVLNRPAYDDEIARVIGDFTTVSLLGLDQSGVESFAARAKRASSTLFEDLDHRLYSGIECIRELARSKGREASMMPYVFTSAIGLLGTQMLRGRFEGTGISQTPQLFIDCQAMDGPFGLQINWDIREGVFPKGLVEDMFDTFRNSIFRLADAGNEWDKACSIELPLRQQEERAVANKTDTYFTEKQLYSGFLDGVRDHKHSLAVADEAGTLTYGELHEKALEISAKILEMGGQAGDHIPVIMKKSRYQVAAVLGILYVGGVYVPIDIHTAPVRMEAILENIGAKMAVGSSDELLEFLLPVVDVMNVGHKGELPTPVDSREEEPAYILFTSGTTGMPKGVVITHAAAMNTIEDINRKLNVGSSDRILGVSQLNFDLSVYDIFGILSAGGAIIYPAAKNHMNPESWAGLFEKYRITLWNSVPALMEIYLSYLCNNDTNSMDTLRVALLSGDWVPLSMPERIRGKAENARVICMGGATEASIWSNYHEYSGLGDGWVSIPYGVPLANQGMYVLDAEGRDCPVWVAGNLYIAGKGLAKGYYGDPALTSDKFTVNLVHGLRMYQTGDRARYLPGGEIEFLGRNDKQIKIRGYRIELGEIEHALESHSAVHSAIACVDFERAERPIYAAVELKDCAEGAGKEACKDGLELFASVEVAADSIKEKLTQTDYQKAFDKRDKATEIAMLYVLQRLGFFDWGKEYTARQVFAAGIVKEKYHWLVKHWILYLENTGMLIAGENGYHATADITHEEYAAAWDESYALWHTDYGSIDLLHYIKDNTDQLPDVLKGVVDPLALLYPNGSKKYTDALYKTNTMTICINRFICECVQKIVQKRPGKRVRILEIGAGTGATSQPVLKMLEENGADYTYHFTDITKYFFSEAQKNFGANSRVVFQEFNADEDYRAQGFHSNSFDIIIGAYVLDNVKNIHKTIGQVEEMLAPEGYFLFSEPQKLEPCVLMSQALLMTPPEDELRQNKTFLLAEEWKHVLDCYSGSNLLTMPRFNSPLYALGAVLYIKQFKQGKMLVEPQEISQHIANYLPEYMQPVSIEIIDSFPLTKNGKTDQNAVASLLCRGEKKNDIEDNSAESSLEKRLSEIWQEVLKVEKIGRRQSFFDFGADSLIMAQTATKIRKDLHVDVPFDVLLRQMLNAPTIEQLANYIEQALDGSGLGEKETEEAGGTEAIFYTMPYGGEPTGRLRVMIHGSLATLDSFDYLGPELVRHGGGEVIGVGLSDLDGYMAIPPDEVIDKLSDLYVEKLLDMGFKKIQLIGYSFGGVVVVEMAKRFMERGIDVEDVSIIDGGRVPVVLGSDLVSEIICLDAIELKPADLGLENKNVLQAIFRKKDAENNNVVVLDDMKSECNDADLQIIAELEAMGQEERFTFYSKLYYTKTGQIMEREAIRRMMLFFIHSMKTLDYTSTPFFGNIRYFTCDNKDGHYEQLEHFMKEWRDVCMGEFQVIGIPGTHLSSIEEKEFCVKLAKQITDTSEVY